MGGQAKIVTGLGKAELDRILVRGYNLTEEILGKMTFSQMTYLMLMGRLPTSGESHMVDALLNVLVEHGLVSATLQIRCSRSQ